MRSGAKAAVIVVSLGSLLGTHDAWASKRWPRATGCRQHHDPTFRCLAGSSSGGATKGDFNGDGFADLAIGIPGEDLEAADVAPDSGAVQVLYGSATGLSASANQFFTQDTDGIPGTAEAGDRFGSSLAAGDFNGDGRSDLAIGVPVQDAGDVVDAGEVQVLYGSGTGLKTAGNQNFFGD